MFLRRSEGGQLVLRWPQIDAEVNRPMPPDQPILRAVQAGQTESVHEYVAFTDGVRRISGTVVVKGYPFFLTVALSTDDLLAGWRRLAWLTGITWLALLAVAATLMRAPCGAPTANGARCWRSCANHSASNRWARWPAASRTTSTTSWRPSWATWNWRAANWRPGIRRSAAWTRSARPDCVRATWCSRSWPSAGRQRHTLVNQPLKPLIEEAVALLRPTLPGNVALDCTLADEPLHADVDATQMQQVLMNLCTNAWHALQDQPGFIHIGLAALEVTPDAVPAGTTLAPGRYAHLWVQDDGSGMDAATQARIFEPFFTTKPTGVGTGLGLSVVHGIVVAHRGAIRVDSTLGRGTTVHSVPADQHRIVARHTPRRRWRWRRPRPAARASICCWSTTTR